MPSIELNVDLSELIAFTRVVQEGSFTAAAVSLSMPKSTLSRKVSELETRVGARLLQRTTRSVNLTDVGRVYYDHIVRVVAELEEAQLAVARLQSTPRGLLRITAPVSFSLLGPLIATYLERQPAVQLELVCTDRRVDLVEERFDLALRAGVPADSSLIARKLGVVRRCLYASPRFIRRVGHLDDPHELARHPSVVFAPDGNTWSLSSGSRRADVTVRPRMVTNDYDLLRAVVRDGYGFALLPEFLCTEDLNSGRLARALPSWATPDVPVFAVYPSARHLSPKVVAFVDLAREHLGASLSPP